MSSVLYLRELWDVITDEAYGSVGNESLEPIGLVAQLSLNKINILSSASAAVSWLRQYCIYSLLHYLIHCTHMLHVGGSHSSILLARNKMYGIY